MRRIWMAVLVLLWSQGTGAACRVEQRARIGLDVVGGTVMVPVQINERTATMILDTGAQRSVVTRDAVVKLDLALDEWVATTMRGVGGLERHRNALPRSISFGGLKLERRTTTRDTSLTVASLPRAQMGGRQIDGLLGRDFLSLYDLELDIRSKSVALYAVQDCTRAFLPWTSPYIQLPVQNPTDTALVVIVELDGVGLRALLDTGASETVLGSPGIARLGLTPEVLARDPSHSASGMGPRVVTTQRHRFKRFRVGNIVTLDPLLWVAPIRITPIVDMLLGADWLSQHVVWISFTNHQVYVMR
ncbi:MAG: retroviral-like aspartic protease family protein [Acetobacteraceae bacterium]